MKTRSELLAERKRETQLKAHREARKAAKRYESHEEKKPELVYDTPNDPINEQIILAAEMSSSEIRKEVVRQFPNPDAFYAQPHKDIHQACILLEQKGLEFDPGVIVRLNPDVDIRLVETLMAARPEPPQNFEYHVRTLQWDSQRAQVASGPLPKFLELLHDPTAPPEDVRAIARQLAQSCESELGRSKFLRRPEDVIKQAIDGLRSRISGDANYKYGIHGLDYNDAGRRRLLPGPAPGLMTVLTGRTGSAKTTLAAHLILGMLREGRKVLVGAWEVRAPMTLELLAVISLRWSRSRLLDGKSNKRKTEDDEGYEPLSDEEVTELEDEMWRLTRMGVRFVDNPFQRSSVRKSGRITNDDYLDHLEELIAASACDVFILDLFDRVLRYRKPDDEQEALWRMVEMVESLNKHGILVHQQLIKGENASADGKPSLAGLKGSAAYAEGAAAVIAPHLPARFKPVPDDTLEVYGLKQRYAPPFAVEFEWEPDTGQITGGSDITMKEEQEDTFGDTHGLYQPKKAGGKKSRRN